MKINSNVTHNILNLAIAAIPALHVFDWSIFFDAETALKIVGSLGLMKIMINVGRDGVTGMIKPQPPIK
jgi:hypothetical protein